MKVEVSNGEIIDKITILLIKSEKISDNKKLINIKKELNELLPLMDEIDINMDDYNFKKLKEMNLSLWDIEDKLRKLESKEYFGPQFVELARLVYHTNDQRAGIKKNINIETNSLLVEEKSYEKY